MEKGLIQLSEQRYLELIQKENSLQTALDTHPDLFEADRLTSSVKRYRKALERLVDDIEEICRSEEFVTIFKIAHMNGANYKGKSFSAALKLAKTLLKR